MLHTLALSRILGRLSVAFLGSRSVLIGPIAREEKCAGTRSAGNTHASSDVAGTGNGIADLPPGHGTSS